MKRILYMATVLPGLENVLSDEIACKLPEARLLPAERGKVFFEWQAAACAEPNHALRTADNLYAVIGSFAAGPHRSDLSLLEKKVAALELPPDLAGFSPSDRFVVNASRRGRQTYSRFEAAEAAMRGIERRYPRLRRGTAADHSVEFRLDLDGEAALFSLRLTDSAFRYRGRDRAPSPAALRPTVAHALVWLTRPAPGDRFIDPCCGSGSILLERAAYPYAGLRGGDLSPEAVQAARANAGEPLRQAVERWDARRLPLDAGSQAAVASNLPFGRQIGERDELAGLYGELLAEIGRVLAPDGRAILLAEDGGLLRQAAERSGFSCGELARLSLKGLQPAVYGLQK